MCYVLFLHGCNSGRISCLKNANLTSIRHALTYLNIFIEFDMFFKRQWTDFTPLEDSLLQKITMVNLKKKQTYELEIKCFNRLNWRLHGNISLTGLPWQRESSNLTANDICTALECRCYYYCWQTGGRIPAGSSNTSNRQENGGEILTSWVILKSHNPVYASDSVIYIILPVVQTVCVT